jgi:pSer/pThr/pTyr-binding forkhead associated (FHA) protein
VSEQLLTILKFCLLALIYLFFFRVIRAVWAELTPPKVAPAPPERARSQAPRPTAVPASGKPKRQPRRAVAPSGTNPHAPLVGRLVVVEPPESRGIAYSLADEISVGRAPGCQVTVDDTFVSQVHARVFCREGNYLVEDLGSTNGTYLNSKKVSGAMIMQRGDRLQVGNTVLELE